LLRENEGVAVHVLAALAVDADELREEMVRMLSGPEATQRTRKEARSDRTRQTIDPRWLDGLGAPINQLAREIRHELGREPDAGDLLLALACAPQTLVCQSLQQLGVDLDALSATIERQRQRALTAQEELDRKIERVRIAEERAIEAQQFDTAAQLRDQERELTEQKRHEQRRLMQAREDAGVSSEILQEIRRRLGLPAPPEPPTTTVG
jgi:UvrB/uvrC motif/Clp amino terminal domain, pathogenicity island component